MQSKSQHKYSFFSLFSKRKSTFKNREQLANVNYDYHPESCVRSLLRKLSFCDSIETQIFTILNAMEAKDPYTKGHSESVALYATLIGRHAGLTEEEIEKLQLAAYLHDVGKIMIDRRLLTKPEKLNATESEVIRRHPEIGSRMLSSLNIEQEVIKAVLHHHERWDGSGYPARLFAYEIPFFSRILAVADAFDAITTNRPYRKAMEIKDAFFELEKNSGQQFDPEMVRLFLKGFKKEFC